MKGTIARLLMVACLTGCVTRDCVGRQYAPMESRPAALESWNGTETRRAIVDFVASVTDPESEDYVAPGDRIATFDNDGTLWCEKPLYVHFEAVFERMEAQIAADPSLVEREPYKAVASKDLAYFMALYETGAYDTLVGQLLGVPFGGMSTDRYEAWMRDWLEGWRHERFRTGYAGLIYQPMVELVRYLHDNDFKVFIVTADESAFLKLISEELYGIPPERVLGSAVRVEYISEEGFTGLQRTYRAEYLDNWAGKPRLIYQTLGKRPILAGGNSNGDFHMLQWTNDQAGPHLSLLVHHTDAEREYAYDSHTDKVMPEALRSGWTIVDMKDDWSQLFSSVREQRGDRQSSVAPVAGPNDR